MSDTTDDLDCFDEDWLLREQIDREKQWQKGIHKTREGTMLLIKNMEASHISNTIKYFEGYNVSPLNQELKRRKVIK